MGGSLDGKVIDYCHLTAVAPELNYSYICIQRRSQKFHHRRSWELKRTVRSQKLIFGLLKAYKLKFNDDKIHLLLVELSFYQIFEQTKKKRTWPELLRALIDSYFTWLTREIFIFGDLVLVKWLNTAYRTLFVTQHCWTKTT